MKKNKKIISIIILILILIDQISKAIVINLKINSENTRNSKWILYNNVCNFSFNNTKIYFK